jgi:hypothetical protein
MVHFEQKLSSVFRLSESVLKSKLSQLVQSQEAKPSRVLFSYKMILAPYKRILEEIYIWHLAIGKLSKKKIIF